MLLVRFVEGLDILVKRLWDVLLMRGVGVGGRQIIRVVMYLVLIGACVVLSLLLLALLFCKVRHKIDTIQFFLKDWDLMQCL